MRGAMERLQPLGRSLMLPIAVLPVAGLLLRLGQPDLLNLTFVASAGNAIFANLGLLFAIGVAVGLARENNGAAGLAGAVAFLVTIEGAKALLQAPPMPPSDAATADAVLSAWRAKEVAKLNVPAGIITGLASGMLYNRFSTIRLPEYLAFFGGRRFVPIAAGAVGVVLAAVFGLGYPWLAGAIDGLSHWVIGAGDLGLFLYGVTNRLLLVTGLHHIINNMVWFVVGDFHGTSGDLNRFFAGDPHAGAFMSGFFPVMMFGLPAACLAMYRAALPERRAEVGGLFLSLAATSFLTGVTEPIEFTFMFLAPVLYVIHALLTGCAMVIMHELHVRLGFGFSAGLIDYLINFRMASRPLLLLPVGVAYFAIYFGLFRYCIVRFDLATPGRRIEEEAGEGGPSAPATSSTTAGAYVAALGGAANLLKIDACTTRLRLEVADPRRVDDAALKRIGARGVVRPGGAAVQVVVGPTADTLASEIRSEVSAAKRNPVSSAPIDDILTALGGAGNIAAVLAKGSRLLLTPVDPARIDVPRLAGLFPRGATRGRADVHLLAGPNAPELAEMLTQVRLGTR